MKNLKIPFFIFFGVIAITVVALLFATSDVLPVLDENHSYKHSPATHSQHVSTHAPVSPVEGQLAENQALTQPSESVKERAASSTSKEREGDNASVSTTSNGTVEEIAATTDHGTEQNKDHYNPAISGKPMPDIRVQPRIGGEEAIKALGDNLAAVAAHYGQTPEGLKKLFRNDPTLRLDGNANLYYEETNLHEPIENSIPETTQKAAPHQEHLGVEESLVTDNLPLVAYTQQPLSQTFLLHSKPGASKIIYLDFDGHTVSGTQWNITYTGGAPFIQTPWDMDGSPSTFSDAEKIIIQQVWAEVADTFAPFDVNVTTEDPGDAALTRSNYSDTQYGIRALISHANNELFCPNSSGGVSCSGLAYLNAFGAVGDTLKPALIFSNYSNGTPDSRPHSIATIISHEIGHNLGLSHDGTSTEGYYKGHGYWAPVMGTAYDRQIVQWSKGEYADANNQQDDLSIIAASVPYRANDFGFTLSTATPLGALTENGISISGIIANSSDIDFTSFTVPANKLTTVKVTPSPSMLHAVVRLYNSSGEILATGESVDSASGTGAVEIGSYFSASEIVYVSVSGKGTGNPLNSGYSDYGSLGKYTLSLSTPTTQSITFPQPEGGVLGSAPYALTAYSNSNLPVSFVSTTPTICTITASGTVTLHAVGSCSINVNQAGNGSIPAAEQITRTFAVKNSQNVTFNKPSDVLMGVIPYKLTATVSSELQIWFWSYTENVCTVDRPTGMVTILTVGKCTISAYQIGNTNYWPAAAVIHSFHIRNFNQIITFDSNPGPKIFGGSPFSVSATTTSTSPVIFSSKTPAVCTVTGSLVTIVSAGSCTVAANAAMDANYLAAVEVTQTIVINKGSQTITFGANPGPRVLGSAPFTVSATTTSTSPVIFSSITPQVCTVTGSAVASVSAGTCTIAANAASDANYIAATQVTQEIVIEKKMQNIVLGVNPGPKTFGDEPFAVSASTQSTSTIDYGSATPNICSVSGNTVTILAAGYCYVTLDAAEDSTYQRALQKKQLVVINKAQQVITFDSNLGPRYFGTEAFNVSATTSSSSPVILNSTTPAVCTVANSIVTVLKAGNCTIAANAAADGNYLVAAQVTQTVIINKALQVISFGANPGPREYGTGAFSVSAETPSTSPVIFSSKTPAVCTVNNSVVSILGVGTCVIAADAAMDANYQAASQVTQTILINKGVQVITFNQPVPVASSITSFTVSATGGASGNSVTFSSTTPNVCTVTLEGIVTTVAAGDCIINADQLGNDNYFAAAQVSKSLSILPDLDNDGVVDAEDNCPQVANANQLDWDGNGIGDKCDNPVPLPENITGISKADKVGVAVAFAGDFDGDGYGDYVIGVPNFDRVQALGKLQRDVGYASVISGKNGGVLAEVFGSKAKEMLGFAVAGGADINNDGFDDVVIGMPKANKGAGALLVLYGPGLQKQFLNGQAKSAFGSALALADVNNDNYADIIVGSPKVPNNIGLKAAGRVAVISGLNFGLLNIYHGSSANALAGTSVAAADIDGDGGVDIIIGAPKEANNELRMKGVGSVTVYNQAGEILFKEYGKTLKSQFGMSLAAGDINNDGYADVLVGAPMDDDVINQIKDAGSVTLFSGRDGNQLIKKYGELPKANFGNSVAVGDVNGDGAPDLIIGAWKDDKSSANPKKRIMDVGSVSIFSGNGFAAIGATRYGDVAKDYFGATVAAGDINGDGKDDLIIGIPGFDRPIARKALQNVGQIKLFSGADL